MEISTWTTKTIVLVTLLFAAVVQAAVIPEKDRWRQDESWAEEYNLVEPPPNQRLHLVNFFEKPHEKSKSAPSMSLKTIIKALYQLNAFDDKSAMEDQNVEDDRQTDEDTKLEELNLSPEATSKSQQQEFSGTPFNMEDTTVPQLSVELSAPKESDTFESHEETTRSLGILLEDLVDAAHLPTHVESDRTEKFTHSFRYGYGIPFHPQGV
ncbi:uncharacterized protein LOC111055342 [Nilaparvata lugens]|uniref:uncharacterized protein LOC111055342 n=1 Tax=Nilaparvata lugens TaxID=108931 RepID=UPI00193E3561|nr:uncharacterized protein LOC111055342 [Nilaparvata lugens]